MAYYLLKSSLILPTLSRIPIYSLNPCNIKYLRLFTVNGFSTKPWFTPICVNGNLHPKPIFDNRSRYFRNFGHLKSHESPKLSRLGLFVYSSFAIIMISIFLNFEKIYEDFAPEKLKEFFKTQALSDINDNVENGNSNEIHESVETEKTKEHPKKQKKDQPGFHDRKIIEYENRVRAYSTPDKIFRYFATLRVHNEHGENDIFMTPEDFLRSITPGIKQPDGFGLDQYRKLEIKSGTYNSGHKLLAESESKRSFGADSIDSARRMQKILPANSIFYKLGTKGLINFSDFIFLLTILSASRRHFEIAFRMFDLNGDGDVDYEEFEMVQTIIRNQTSIGMRHRDHNNTGNIYKGVSSALATYFFGEKLDQKLTVEKFLDFQKQLQTEILSLEFRRKEPNEEGRIREVDFADLLLTYAGLSDKKQIRMIKKIKKRFKHGSEGITLEDYLQFFHFLNNINDVDTALTFYHIAGASIDHATLKHVAKTVAHVELNDHVVDVCFTLFDENLDGQLSNKEFVNVMKERLQRGLEKPKDTGFVKLINSMSKCAMLKKPVLLDV